MLTHANGSHDSTKNRGNHAYTSLLYANGSFGSAFWQKDSTNRAGSGNDEETWSTAANASIVDESEVKQNENGFGSNEQIKKAKRKG